MHAENQTKGNKTEQQEPEKSALVPEVMKQIDVSNWTIFLMVAVDN